MNTKVVIVFKTKRSYGY